MKGIAVLMLAVVMAFSASAQQTNKRQSGRKKAVVTQKKQTGKTTAKGKSQASKGKKQPAKGKNKKKKQVYTNAEIKGLQNERSQIQRRITEQQRRLQANQKDVKERLQNLMIINSEINAHQKAIEGYENDIRRLDGNIGMLKTQRATLEQQLIDKKQKFVHSMRYLAKRRNMQETMMFVFSAKSLTEAYRRMRFVKGYAAYLRTQGEQIKEKQLQIDDKNRQLEVLKTGKNHLLYQGKKEKSALQSKQDEQQKVVKTLQNQQKTIESVIAEQQKKQAALNAQIDRLIAIEVEKARQRAAEEARRRAEAAALAKKKREEERARQRAIAEAKARENARRIAEAKAKEEQRRIEAAEAAKRNTEERQRAAQALREAEAERLAAERKAEADKRRNEQAEANAKKAEREEVMMTSVDRQLSGNFESNRGRLPIPVTGNYKIVSHFGQYNVAGLRNVRLDNKGINIMGQPGAAVRSIFAGEVSAVFGHTGTIVVMVRHGSYISVYCNLKSVSVQRGQKVAARQTLGRLGDSNILQFQLRHETRKLNPEVWLGR